MFSNLIQNASDAMPEGGTLTISAKTVDGQAELRFKDTGAGVAEEDLHRLFEPLFTTKAKGIGLGLAIVSSIIERHNGSVEATSNQGDGATFIVRLPIESA